MLNLFFPSNLFAVKIEASDKTKITNCKNNSEIKQRIKHRCASKFP